MVDTGSAALNFELPDENSNKRTLSEFAGSFVVVYFYPEDDTPGCTKEACAIRDSYAEFGKAGIVVLGISQDSPESHKKFKEKYNLPFTLLSDTEEKVIKAYDAYGVAFNRRITYIVSPQGIIVKSYPSVDPVAHAKQILDDIKNLSVLKK